MTINVQTIPHEKQRYSTIGDWFLDKNGDLQIRVSDMGNEKFEYLVADHEIREAMLCKSRGITEGEVTDFDMKFESERLMKLHSDTDEPGDDPRAPYRKEHFFSSNIEALTAAELGVDWFEYEKAIHSIA